MDKRIGMSRLIGRRALVEKDITEFEPGIVKVGYEEWRAAAEDNEELAAGTTVVVTGFEGVTLKVRKEAIEQ